SIAASWCRYMPVSMSPSGCLKEMHSDSSFYTAELKKVENGQTAVCVTKYSDSMCSMPTAPSHCHLKSNSCQDDIFVILPNSTKPAETSMGLLEMCYYDTKK